MAKHCILLAILFVGGLALPAVRDDSFDVNKDMSIFFNHIKSTSGRIVGGSEAAEGAFPWQVAISSGIIQSFSCGGSVITNRHVLTAAHCIERFGPPHNPIMSPFMRVRVGTNVWNEGGQSYRIGGFRVHEENDWFFSKNDIGILITRSAIEMNSRVAAVTLNSRFMPGNIPAVLSGFGRIEAGGPLSDRLMELRKITVDSARCVKEVKEAAEQLESFIPSVDPETNICAFNAVNQGACSGDSGSALVMNVNQQIGIVSWGVPCARGAPDVYVRVSAYIDWIIVNTRL